MAQMITAEAINTKTGKARFAAIAENFLPLIECPLDSEASISKTMLLEFINGRAIKNDMDRYHFINWCLNFLKATDNKDDSIKVVVATVERSKLEQMIANANGKCLFFA